MKALNKYLRPGVPHILVITLFFAFISLCGPAWAAISANKSFSPINIFPGQTSTVTISLYNSSQTDATSAAFTDTFLSGITALSVGPNTCGGSVSITPNTQISLTGGTIPAGNGITSGSCSVSFVVTSSTSGTYVDNIDPGAVTTSQGNNADMASATLTVAAVLPLTAGNTFTTSYIHVTGVSTMTFTLTNPNIGPLTNATLTDNFPTPLVIATPVTTGGTCAGATFTTTGGGTLAGGETGFKVSGATIPTGGSCTVTVNVGVLPSRTTTYQNATVNNSVAIGGITTTEGASNTTAVAKTITVQSGAGLTGAFAPTQVFLNGNSTLTLTLSNYNMADITGASITDTMPAGLTVVGPVSTTCPNGTANFTASQIQLTGATIPAAANANANSSGTCTVTATVKGTTATSGANTTTSIAAGTFAGSGVGYNGTGNIVLTVLASPETVAMAFSPASIVNRLTSTLTITLANGSGLNAAITSFTDLLTTMGTGAGGVNYTVAATPAATTTCGGTLSASPGSTSITMTGGQIPANGNCQIVVPVQAPDVVGTKTNTVAIGGLVTSLGNNSATSTANLITTDNPAVAASFLPTTVDTTNAPGVSRLTLTITHSGAVAFNTMAFTNNLPAGLTLTATPNPATNCSGGTVTATPGGTAIALSGASMPVGANTCTVSVNVQTPQNAVGNVTHTFPIGGITTDVAMSNEAVGSATLGRVLAGQATLNTSFSPVTANGGSPVTLSVTIANTNSGNINLTGGTLTDTLPAGMQVYTAPAATFTGAGCTLGIVTAVPGSNTFTLTGASIAANSTCTVSLKVAGTAAGNLNHTLPIGAFTSDQGVRNNNSPSVSLTVQPSVNVGTFFSPNPMEVNGTSALTVRLFNTFASAQTASFTDNLPSAIKIAAVPNASTTCTGGGLAYTPATGTSIALTNGTIPAGGYCDVTVNVSATATGNGVTYTNTIAAGAVSTSGGATNPDQATAVLTVIAKPTITEAFNPASIPLGATSTVTYTLANANTTALVSGGLTGASFSDTLPAGMTVSVNQNAAGSCVGANTNPFTGGQSGTLNFSGLTIPAAGNCTVTIIVTTSATGSYPNPVSGVLTSQTQTQGTTGSATLTVIDSRPVLTKSFSPNPTTAGSTVGLTFTLSNPNSVAISFSGAVFSDVFPTTPGAMTIADTTVTKNGCASATVQNNSGGTLTVGDPGIKYNYTGSIAANSSCTVTVDVTAGVPGLYSNTSTVATSTTAGTSTLAATADLTILQQTDLAVTQAMQNPTPNVGSQDTFTVTVTNNGPVPTTNVTILDTLPSGFSFVSANPSQGSFSSFTGVWSIGTMGVGASVTLDITGTVLASGSYGNTAAITNSDIYDYISGNNSATATLTPTPVADVTTTVSAPATAHSGSPVTVPISFRNNGPSQAAGVVYGMTILPAGLGGVSCTGATCAYDGASGIVTVSGLPNILTSGQTLNLTLSYTAPDSGSVGVTSVIGTTTSQGSNLGADSATGTTAATQDTSTADVTTNISAPASANAGATVAVGITYLNLGPGTSTGMTYAASLPTGVTGVSCTGATCSYNSASGSVTISGLPGSLTSGQSVGITLSYTAPPVSSVTVTSAIGTTFSQGANTASDTASGSTTISSIADVATSVAAPADANAGSTVFVPVLFTNNGPSPAAGVTYGATLSTGLSGVSCTGAVCAYNAGTGSVTIGGLPGSLANGQTESVILAYTAPASGSVTTTATIGTTTNQGGDSGANTASDTTSVTGATTADVTTALTAPLLANAGTTVSVGITYLNLGPAPATGVNYSATLPAGLSGVGCTGATCAYNSGTGSVTVSGLPATLANGQAAQITLSYTAPASGSVGVAAGITATGSQGANSAPDTASASTGITSGVTVSDVTTSVSAPSSANAGSTVPVSVSYLNLGPDTATSVTYSITLPSGLSGVSCTGATCSYNSGTGSVTVSGLPTTLGNGASQGLTLSYTAPSSGSINISSSVSVPVSAVEANYDNNSAGGTTAAIPVADVAASVTAPAYASVASAVTVPVSFRNNGPSVAAGLTYTLTLPAGLSGVSCSGSGISCTYSGTTATISGLPTSLTSGQVVNFNLNYTAPAGSGVTVTATIGTSTSQGSDAGANTASGSTSITYTVSFTSNGGTAVTSQSVAYNTTAATPATPTRTGYAFSGWYSDAGLTQAFAFTTPITGTTTLYAKWTINTYTVSFATNGGTAVGSQSITYNTTATTPATPTKTGYTFSGWYSDAGLSAAFAFTTPITVDTTLYAKWTVNTYTVSFATNGGTAVGSQSITYNTTATAPASPTKTGSTFNGWYSDAGLSAAFAFTTPITADTTLYAKWTVNSYTVSFATNGGTAVGSQSIAYNTTATAPATPTKTGSTFSGWYSDAGLSSAFAFTTPITVDTTLYAKWTVNSYTVSFNSNGGTAVGSQSVAYNTTATTPAPPTKTGSGFAGWYSDAGLTSLFAFTTPITVDTMLYAKWTTNSYTVSFNSNGGSAVGSQSVAFNGVAATPASPTKTGSTFAGWYSDAGLSSAFAFTTTITADTALYAKWTINSYTVSFNSNGGSAVGSQSIAFNGVAATPASPTRTGSTFAGWYSDAGLTSLFAFTAPITATTTLYAKWTINSYTVSFNSNGGTTVGSQSIAYNAIAATPVTPTKTGSSFAGWYSDAGLTLAFAFTTPITVDTTLFAKWTSTGPVTTATPAGGSYTAASLLVTLTSSNPAATIYYSTDGSQPAKAYSAPLPLSASTTLRYYAADGSGTEAVKTASYTITTSGPPKTDFSNVKAPGTSVAFTISRSEGGKPFVPVVTNTTQTTYTDTAPLKPNTIYQYAVTSNVDPTQTVFMSIRTPLYMGWNIVAVPYATSGVPASTFFASPVSAVYQWNPSGATPESSNTQLGSYTTVSTLTPGLGYFVKATNNSTLLMYSGAAGPASATVTLKPGWTMIANPNTTDKTDIGSTWLIDGAPLATAVVSGKIGNSIYWWNGSTYDFWTIASSPIIEPWKAYWIVNLDSVSHTLTIQ